MEHNRTKLQRPTCCHHPQRCQNCRCHRYTISFTKLEKTRRLPRATKPQFDCKIPQFANRPRSTIIQLKRRFRSMDDEANYICQSCGEEIVIPIDLSAGHTQEYVEDCPACCCPNVIHVWIDESSSQITVTAEADQ